MSSGTSFETAPQGRMREMIAQGDIPSAAALAQALHAASALDGATAEWLLRQARGWHADGFPAEQKAVCEVALHVLPDHFEALHLLGYAAQTRGEHALAESYYARSLARRPDYAYAKLALAQMRMMRSNFSEGRDLYEARFDAVTEASGPDWRGLPIARWRGEPVAGRKIYLWAEQGLGDIVMFAGFLPYLLSGRPGRVALGMFPKLVSLFSRSFPGVAVEPIDDAMHHALAPAMMQALPQIEKLSQYASVPFSLEPLRASYDYARRHGLFDAAAPMGDLLVYAMPGYIPARHPSPYLIPDPGRLAATAKRLGGLGQGRRVGISWHTTNRREAERNVPLEEWLPLLALPGCHFISLQHQVSAAEIADFCARHGCRITVDPDVDMLQDAEGLAALIGAMDEVVTIDNSNAHLAGALGIPTTLLLPAGCNYRWPAQEGGGTLWYSSVTALRQRQPLRWDSVMASAAARLSGGAVHT